MLRIHERAFHATPTSRLSADNCCGRTGRTSRDRLNSLQRSRSCSSPSISRSTAPLGVSGSISYDLHLRQGGRKWWKFQRLPLSRNFPSQKQASFWIKGKCRKAWSYLLWFIFLLLLIGWCSRTNSTNFRKIINFFDFLHQVTKNRKNYAEKRYMRSKADRLTDQCLPVGFCRRLDAALLVRRAELLSFCWFASCVAQLFILVQELSTVFYSRAWNIFTWEEQAYHT